MAVEFPLVLYDCEFENLQWLYDREVQEFNVTHLQQLWANHAVKTQVLRNMLGGLDAAPVATGKSKGWFCRNTLELRRDGGNWFKKKKTKTKTERGI